jgi:hypothetical protein
MCCSPPLIKGLGAIRAKICPTSDFEKNFSKMYSQYELFRKKPVSEYVHIIPHSGPTMSGKEKH